MNHTILILGPSGSGKTTFFASFYKKLSLAGDRNFFLKTKDAKTRKHLVELYTKLATGEWARGTRNMSRWTFDCCVKTSDQTSVEACKLDLFDYKGGSITDVPEPEDGMTSEEDDFTEATQQASAFLAILDGEKVLAFMQDVDLMSPTVNNWLLNDLDNVLQIIEGKQGDFPLHLLISKWDVLVDADYSLKDIKRRLFQKVPSLEALISKRDRAKKPVYLIPISAFGQGFASLKNGRMEKIPGKSPAPFGVEVPLALTLTDLHKDILGNQSVSEQPVKSSAKPRTGSCLGFIVYFLIGLVMIAVLNIWGLLILGAYMLFRLLSKSKPKNTRSRTPETSASAVSSEGAFRQLLAECRQIREDFLRRFPEAICTEIEQGVQS